MKQFGDPNVPLDDPEPLTEARMTIELDPHSPEALASAVSLGTDMYSLISALAQCGEHAAAMQSANADYHDDCPWCETMKLVARVGSFGEQLRSAERRRLAK